MLLHVKFSIHPVPFIPPEKPLQLANTMRGRRSRLKSQIAWAVLKAESGNHTWPACCRTWRQHTQSSEEAKYHHIISLNHKHAVRFTHFRFWVQVCWIGWDCQLHWARFNSDDTEGNSSQPVFIQQNCWKMKSLHTRISWTYKSSVNRFYRALPVTTVRAHDSMISMKEPWSKNPLCQAPLTATGINAERKKMNQAAYWNTAVWEFNPLLGTHRGEVSLPASSGGHTVLLLEYNRSLCRLDLQLLLQEQGIVCSVRRRRRRTVVSDLMSCSLKTTQTVTHSAKPLAYRRATWGWWRRPQSRPAQSCVWLRCCAWSGSLPAGCWRCRPLCPKPSQTQRLQCTLCNFHHKGTVLRSKFDIAW